MHKILYLGLDPTRYNYSGHLVHCPIIKTIPKKIDQRTTAIWPSITHILFTSPSAVNYWQLPLKGKRVLSIGPGTSAVLTVPSLIAPFPTQEGVIELLESLDLKGAHLCWPRSSKSRPLLQAYLEQKKISFHLFALYETQTNVPSSLPNLAEFDEIIFTSPTTVQAFIELFGSLPRDKILTPIGPVTAKLLQINL